jgi:hypothetical protein
MRGPRKKVQIMTRFRTLPLIVGFLSLATGAAADLPAIIACADKTDPKERLACYDDAVAKLKVEVTEAQKKKTTLFGFSLPFGDSDSESESSAQPTFGPKEVRQIDAMITAVKQDLGGHYVLTLDNGQVWRIEDARTLVLHPGKDLVAIVRNDFGGFYLSINGTDNKLSVNRLK